MTNGSANVRAAWRKAVSARASEGAREPSWRERGNGRRATTSSCLIGDLVMSHDTDPLTPRGTRVLRRIPPPVVVVVPPPPPFSRASSFKKTKPPDVVDATTTNSNDGSDDGSNNNNNNNNTAKKSIRFAESQKLKRPRRGSGCMQQQSWERMMGEQHPLGSGKGLVLIPFFDGSFRTVWAPSPAASAVVVVSQDTSANSDHCECRCRLPLTARVWAVSKWYVCFMPTVLCMPVAVGADLVGACCCCCCAAPAAAAKDAPSSTTSSSSTCSTPSAFPPQSNFMPSP